MENKFEWSNELVKEFLVYAADKTFIGDINAVAELIVNDFIKSKNPTLLYETNDGHKVYSEDTYPIYFVSYDFKKAESPANKCLPKNNPDYKYFLFEANAISYIELNQPRLSVADANYYIKEYGSSHTNYRLIEFANNRKVGKNYNNDWDK